MSGGQALVPFTAFVPVLQGPDPQRPLLCGWTPAQELGKGRMLVAYGGRLDPKSWGLCLPSHRDMCPGLKAVVEAAPLGG